MTDEALIPIFKAWQGVQIAIGRVELSQAWQLTSAVEELLAARSEMENAVAHYGLRKWAAREEARK